jgi:hypothetical protein
MLDYRDLWQWDRFITPTIIKTVYALAIAVCGIFGVIGILNGLSLMAINPFMGFAVLIASIIAAIFGMIVSRVAAEFILIVFRINEHLGAIRDQGQAR